MNNIARILLFISFLTYCNLVQSQGKFSKEFTEGKIEFYSLNYFSASETFKKIYLKTDDKNEKMSAAYYLAMSALKTKQYKSAESYFSEIVNNNCNDTILFYYHAFSIKAQGRYSEAKDLFIKYSKFPRISTLCNMEIEGINNSENWINSPESFKVQTVSVLNSPYDESGISYVDKSEKSVVFSSNREESNGKANDPRTGLDYYDLYFSKADRKTEEFEEPSIMDELINTSNSENYPRIDPKFRYLYLTTYSLEKGYGLKIAEKMGTSWQIADNVPVQRMNDTLFIGQCDVANDNLEIYFSANLPGGYGGKDIWVVNRRRENGMWVAEPINLGPEINSAQDEEYPIYHTDGYLYYSSNGKGGMGGYDIFRSKRKSEEILFSIPENMKFPINSSGDDMGIIFSKSNETIKGFLLSNRSGGKGGLDIYSFYIPTVKVLVNGKLLSSSGTPSVSQKIVLSTNSGVESSSTTDENGKYSFSVNLMINDRAKLKVMGVDSVLKEIDFDIPQSENKNELTIDIQL